MISLFAALIPEEPFILYCSAEIAYTPLDLSGSRGRQSNSRCGTSEEAMAKKRVHLTFTGKLAEEPILWQLSQTFDVVFNIRQADFTEGIGWIMAELEGDPQPLENGIMWLEEHGVHVAPIEQDVVS